jgi:hypothetical protein
MHPPPGHVSTPHFTHTHLDNKGSSEGGIGESSSSEGEVSESLGVYIINSTRLHLVLVVVFVVPRVCTRCLESSVLVGLVER